MCKDASCSSWTSKLITAKDHAAVQVNIGHLDEAGVYTGEFTTIALAGGVRVQGNADSAIDHMWRKMSAEVNIWFSIIEHLIIDDCACLQWHWRSQECFSNKHDLSISAGYPELRPPLLSHGLSHGLSHDWR